MRNIKCSGRFKDLTDELSDALPLVANGKNINEQVLKETHSFLKDSLAGYDTTDPYFCSQVDVLRPQPQIDENTYRELVPLISRQFDLDDSLANMYASRQGAKGKIAQILGDWKNVLDLDDLLNLRLSERSIPFKRGEVPRHELKKKGQEQACPLSSERTNLTGYSLRTKFGIGGTENDAVVPDAPYSIEVFDSRENLCLLIGFWYKHNNLEDTLVISQIQQPQNANIPGKNAGAQMGIVALEIAKIVASAMGIKTIQTYSADKHPMFLQFPERKARMKGEFTGYYDTSAKALGYEGTRSTYYTLKI